MRVSRNVGLFYWYNFFLDFRPYFPIEVLYFQQITGSFASALTVPSVVMLSTAVFEVPTGVLSDLAGRRRTAILSSFCHVASLLLYAIGGTWWMLAAGAVFHGVGRAFSSGNNDALLYETLVDEGRKDEYATYSGRTSSMFQAGLAAGALVCAATAWKSLSLVVWLSVFPQIACLLVSFFFVEPAARERETTNAFAHLREALRLFARNKRLGFLTLGSAMKRGIGEAMFSANPSFIASLWPIWGTGAARALNHLFGWLSFWFAGRIIKHFSAYPALIGALCLNTTIGFIAFAFPTVLSPLLMTSLSLLFGVIMVSMATLGQREFSDAHRATMGSLGSLASALLFAAAAPSIGFLIDEYGPARALLAGHVVLMTLIPLYALLYRHDRRAS